MRATVILLFFLYLPSLLTQPFTLYQTIILPDNMKSWGTDISDDNEILVVGSTDNNTYVYQKMDSGYEEVQKLTESTYKVYDVDITGDGQWLIVSGSNDFNSTHHNATIFTYRKDNQTNRFQHHQTIQSENLQSPSGAITDDHQWIVMGEYWNPAGIKIYRFNKEDDSFNLHQNFTFNQSIEYVNAIDITNDHQFLVICTDISVLVYRYNETSDQFQFNQGIDLPERQFIRKIFLTDDHKYLTVSKTDSISTGGVYKFNETTNEFQLENSYNYQPLHLYYISLSHDQQWICFSIQNLTKIMSLPNSNLQYEIKNDSFYHKLSHDGAYLISPTFSEKVYIFRKNCTFNATESHFFDQNSGQCKVCQIKNCQTCQSLDKCSQCQSGFILDQYNYCKKDLIILAIALTPTLGAILLFVALCWYKKNRRIEKKEIQKMYDLEAIKDPQFYDTQQETMENYI